MNKEFMMLSDGNIAVTNENGNISKRNNSDNIHEILLLENKIEIVDDTLKKLNKDLFDKKGMEFLTKNMLKFQGPLVLVSTIVGVSYGVLSYPADSIVFGIYYGIRGLVQTGFICGAVTIMHGVARLVNKKKIKQINAEISVSKNLKEKYGKELLNVKEKQSSIKTQTITINEPVSLIEQTNVMEFQVNEELNRKCKEYLKDKPKQKVLTRHNK